MLVLALALGLGVVSATVRTRVCPAAPPADPDANYQVHPGVGNWVICAASFTGDDAPELARQLVSQIRSRWHLPAYVFNRADEERRRQQEELEAEQRLVQQFIPNAPVRRRTIRVEEQCAVLVGGYPDMESARRTLDQIKRLPVPDLHLNSGRSPLGVIQTVGDDNKPKREFVNPFTTAFVTRNPSIPPAQVSKWDPGLEKFNANEEYSLLRCPRQWTLLVKEYAGCQVVQTGMSGGIMKDLWPGSNKPGQALDAAGLQAHELARVLRQLNFQSYVLHTRTSSFVTIGAFDNLNEPDVKRVSQQLAALQTRLGAGNPLQLARQPLPMQVPKPPARNPG
jgi:hypothetical protein